MPVFFSHARGSVRKITNGPHRGMIPFKISLPGGEIANAIVQQAGIEHRGNYQFLHTVNKVVYVYVFGDRVGDLVVGGVAFGVPCQGRDGITSVLQRYNQYRIANRGEPVTVGFGAGIALPAFLTGMSLPQVGAENHLAQWSFRLSFFPKSD